MTSPRSKELHSRALGLMPGGVSSPVRSYPPHPRYLVRGEGAHVWDADGQQYVDLCMAFGPLVLGHAPQVVRQALAHRLADGWLLGAATDLEVDLAEEVTRRMPGVEGVRFVNSGTEATMHALRLARAATGRDVVVKVDGAFHGSHDAVLVKAGSGVATALARSARGGQDQPEGVVATHGLPDSPGVPEAVAGLTRVIPMNDLPAAEEAVAPGDVAAVILEPAIGNMGTIPPESGYLGGLRKLTAAAGTLLVFDEVITGFRLARGGATERYGVTPDLVTLGKALGGGLPLAAFGGRRDLMRQVAPEGSVYQAGTFSGNPLSVTAGLATLGALDEEAYRRLDEAGARLARGLADVLADRGVEAQVQQVGSMMSLFFTNHPVKSAADARTASREPWWRLFHRLLDLGVYLPPSPFETWFVSTAHTRDVTDAVVTAVDQAIAEST